MCVYPKPCGLATRRRHGLEFRVFEGTTANLSNPRLVIPCGGFQKNKGPLSFLLKVTKGLYWGSLLLETAMNFSKKEEGLQALWFLHHCTFAPEVSSREVQPLHSSK